MEDQTNDLRDDLSGADWFTVAPIGPGMWRLSEPIGKVAPMFDVGWVHMYLVAGRERAALIDSGMGIGDLRAAVSALTNLPVLNLATHSHWDHVAGSFQFAERRIHAAEASRLNEDYEVEGVTRFRAAPATDLLDEGQSIDLGGRVLQVWHTPGHSPGHVSFFEPESASLFCADTAYAGTLWMQTDDANLGDWRASLQRIAASPARALYGGRESQPQSPALIERLLAGLASAETGASTDEPFPFDPPNRKHRFDGFNILLRDPVR